MLDTSGSMSGFPIEKAKEAIRAGLDGLYPQDTFNLITFSGATAILFPAPVPATPENIRKAQEFLASRSGRGGTEMMNAIRASLDPSDSSDHVRIVCFLTDGYVGNDMEIIAEVQKHSNARVFAFGIGTAVNHFLLDNMAKYGRGEVEYVNLNDDGSAAARRFHERIRNPLLTDIAIDWGGLHVTDVYPRRIPDLFAAKPVIVTGRYTAPGSGTVRLRGKVGGRTFLRELNVTLPGSEPAHDVLAPLWARTRIEDLMGQDYAGAQRGAIRADLRDTITELGLDYRLMTQFTSFVAVEEMVTTEGGQPRHVEVPVDMPEGVSYEGVFGIQGEARARYSAGPIGQGSGGGIGGGVAGGLAARLSPAPLAKATSPINGPAVAPMSEVVEATSAAPLLQTQQANAGNVMESQEVANLPLATRNYNQLTLLTPGDAKSNMLHTKLHPSLFAVVERLKKPGAQPSDEEAKLAPRGKIEIQIWLSGSSAQALERLKQLGFETVLTARAGNSVIGRIAVEKLAALAALDIVHYVEPFSRP